MQWSFFNSFLIAGPTKRCDILSVIILAFKHYLPCVLCSHFPFRVTWGTFFPKKVWIYSEKCQFYCQLAISNISASLANLGNTYWQDWTKCSLCHSVHCNNTGKRQITLRIVGCNFSSRLTATLNLCLIYLKSHWH